MIDNEQLLAIIVNASFFLVLFIGSNNRKEKENRVSAVV
jgi:hypothetical protein